MSIIGREYPDYLEGENMADLISGKTKTSKKKYVVSEQRDDQKTVVDKKWKLYFKDYKNISIDNMELYDLENDLYEQKNLVKEKPEVVDIKINQLKEFLNTYQKNTQPKYNFPDWIDEIKKEKLINGGYF